MRKTVIIFSFGNSGTLKNPAVTELNSREETEVIQVNYFSGDTFHSEPIANNLRQLKRSVVTTNINSSDTFSTNEELTEHVPSKLVTNKQKLVQRKVLPGILMTDHSYAAACTNNIVPFVNSCANSENIAENRSINIDHLYYLNCEPSSELSSFMISDSSYESVRIIISSLHITQFT